MQIIDDFSNAKVIVVGDMMLDRYWWGSVSRISPEAPVPVVKLTSSSVTPGGAANVAVNVAGLGAKPKVFGMLGSDDEARVLRGLLTDAGLDVAGLFDVPDHQTTVKTRVVANGQQIARIDQETSRSLPIGLVDEFLTRLNAGIETADAIIVSDYAKGLLSETVLTSLIETAKKFRKNVLVDPKGKQYAKYLGATMITPNRREAAEACNLDESTEDLVDRAGKTLLDDFGFDAVLITQGDAGMTLFRQNQTPAHFPAAARQVYDVTGAGDTVIATLATALGAGATLEAATQLANIAAGLVIEQVGTTSVDLAQFRKAIYSLK